VPLSSRELTVSRKWSYGQFVSFMPTDGSDVLRMYKAPDLWRSGDRPSSRRGTTRFADRRMLFGRVSAEGAIAAGCLPAGRVRRQGGVGLQRQHHGNLLTRIEVGRA
jgi:hypothetical protein